MAACSRQAIFCVTLNRAEEASPGSKVDPTDDQKKKSTKGVGGVMGVLLWFRLCGLDTVSIMRPT